MKCSDKRVHTKSAGVEVLISLYLSSCCSSSHVFFSSYSFWWPTLHPQTQHVQGCCFLAFIFSSSSICFFCFSHPRIEVCKMAGMAYITFLGFAYLNAVKKMQMRRVRERDSYWGLSFSCMEQEWVLVGLCYILQASPTAHRSTVNVWSESTSVKYLKFCSSCSATLFMLDKNWLCEPAGRKPTK